MFPEIEAEQIAHDRYAEIAALVKRSDVIIARGNGRCYGDSSLQTTIFSTLKLHKFLSFDAESGVIHCEAGVLLSDILEVIVPKGFFLPVTPGTKLITIGGAVASNIHGKNHHTEGAISKYVEAIVLLTENGEILKCTSSENNKLFSETNGGMGLTGIILSVTLRLKKIESAYIRQKTIKAKNIDELLAYFEKYKQYTYSVAWIDCMMKGNSAGRSILMLGEHALRSELNQKKAAEPYRIKKTNQLNIPFILPSFVLSRIAMKAFNFLFYNKQLKFEADNLIHYEPYFYPLDAIRNWNRIYGKNGIIQYQFVIPFEKGKEGLDSILSTIQKSGCASFLAVLKTFGPAEQNVSPLSFPAEGYTLAMDFKVSKRAFDLCEKLDEIVIACGGRVYLTKDARMKKDTFLKSYNTNPAPSAKFSSLQSQRLGITQPA